MAAFVRECIASPLVELTPKNFPAITESTAVIDFYAPWCPPCMRLLPELRAAAKEMPHMKFGSVDCTAHSQLCTQVRIVLTRSYDSDMGNYILHRNCDVYGYLHFTQKL